MVHHPGAGHWWNTQVVIETNAAVQCCCVAAAFS